MTFGKYILEMMSSSEAVSWTRWLGSIIVLCACFIAIYSCWIEKDMSMMVLYMLAAAGITKGLNKFAEYKHKKQSGLNPIFDKEEETE